MKFSSNQPIQFDGDLYNPFVSELKYKQLIQQDDETYFQYTPESTRYTENVILNGDFSESFLNWYQPPNSSWFTGGEATTGEKWAEITNGSGSLFQNSLRGGSTYAVSINVREIIWGAKLQIYFGAKLIKTITTEMGAGLYTFNGTPIVASGGVNFTLKVTAATSVSGDPVGRVKVDNIYVNERFGVELNSIFGIYDMDGVYQNSIRVLSNVLNTGGLLSSAAQYADEKFTVGIDWSTLGLSEGCYKIGVMDSDINAYSQNYVQNGEFIRTGVNQVWTVASTGDATTEIASNELSYTSNAAGTGSATQTGAIQSGRTYQWQMNILAISNCTVTVNVGGTSTTYTTVGSKTGSPTAANGNFSISFNRTGVGASSVSIEYFRMQATTASLVPDYYSNPFDLRTTHDRTVLLNVYNSQNAFGLNFETHNFSPRVRLRSYFMPSNSAYKIDKADEELYNGVKTNFYFKQRKARVLYVENEPEFMHDFLSLLGGFDHIYIDSIEYFVSEDEYSVNWNRFRTSGSVNINMELKAQETRKTRKQLDSGEYILDLTEAPLTDPFNYILTVPSIGFTGSPEPVQIGTSIGNQIINNSVETQ